MRLWSIHPKYLDTKGLVAVWREGLLAKKSLEGKTKGYKNHPQLIRFKKHKQPLNAINAYLCKIYKEAQMRGYNFNRNKIKITKLKEKMHVTAGQIKFEFNHLLKKLRTRDKEKYKKINEVKKPKTNSLFLMVHGEREEWEKT